MAGTFDKNELADALRPVVGEGCVLLDEPMAAHTTFQIGGPADVYVRPGGAEEVAAVLRVCAAHGAPVRVVGRGSDLLVSDAGLRCAVLEIGERLSGVCVRGSRLYAQAGATNAQVAEAACAAGLSGYEFAAGIPGTLGGAAIMNAGAYGGELRDVAVAVECVMPDGARRRFAAWEACWGYRHSSFDGMGCVVVGVELQLRPDDAQAIRARMDDLAARREAKQPLDMPSAGSTFKRPAGHFVGKLVQEAGLRGCRVGGAQVSEKHTGFVVNAGGASAADVRELIAHVQRVVREASGVGLIPEVRMWGFDE